MSHISFPEDAETRRRGDAETFAAAGMLPGESPGTPHHNHWTVVEETPDDGSRINEHETPAAALAADAQTRRCGDTETPLTSHLSPLTSSLTDGQIADAHRRLQALCAFGALRRDGTSAAVAMRLVGLSGTKRSNLEKILRERGLPFPVGDVSAELMPAYIAALTPGIPTGAPLKFPLTQEEALALRGLVLRKSTQDALHFDIAVEEFAHHPACRPETRALILAELDRAARMRRRPAWPTSIRRAGLPTKQEAALFRGPKHAQQVEQTDRRGCYWIDESGERRPLLPHTIWEMDDASDNEPRRSLDPDTGAEILTRQALWTQDVFSAALLGLTQVARPRDSYRIEDVADHVLRCVEDYGLPDIMRLEMGEIWAGQFFHGFVPTLPNTRCILPGWPEAETWGGLAPLCRVVNVFKSKGKGGIEGSFNLVQTLSAHQALTIGRSRGEFEEATTALVRSQRTQEIDERFWDMDTSSAAMREVARRFNCRPKIRRMFGRDAVAPADLLREARGLPLLASERWRFCPVKRLATVRGGHVEITVPHYPRSFRFRVNGGAGVHLDHGYQVLVAFHPGRPEEGCHIFNAECGVRNRDGLRRAERLILAPFAADVPQVDLSGTDGRADSAFSARRKAAAAARRNYRAIIEATRVDYAQSSDGRHLLVEERDGERTVTARSGEREARNEEAGSELRTPRSALTRQQSREQADIARHLLALQTDD